MSEQNPGRINPALSLTEFGQRYGLPGISEHDVIEATTYAIWHHTEINTDVWRFEGKYDDEDNEINPGVEVPSEAAYKALQAALAAAAPGVPASPLLVTAAITPPSGDFAAGALVGPFTVNTSAETAQVSIDPAFKLVDASGSAIDTSVIVDGQQLFIDTTGATVAGGATVTAAAVGAQPSHKIIAVPVATGDTPTAERHAQTLGLVAQFPESALASTSISWGMAVAPEPEPEPEQPEPEQPAPSDTVSDDAATSPTGPTTQPNAKNGAEALAATGNSSPLGAAAFGVVLFTGGALLLLHRRQPRAR